MLENFTHKHPLIFLADDDDDDVYFVRMALKELDSEIRLSHFSNGMDLVKNLRDISNRDQPNLILLDLNMPVLDGRQTLKVIRKEFSQDLPVIILSTSNHSEEKKECIKNGANLYFSKPYSYHNYLDIMRNLKSTWLDKVHA